MVDIYLHIDELERKVDEPERDVGEGHLMQSSATDLITTRDHRVGLVIRFHR